MAEEDAEIALLHQLQAGQEEVAWDDGADGAVGAIERELPSNTEPSDEKVKKEENYADNQTLRAFSPSVFGVLADGGAYDNLPQAPSMTAVATDSRPPSTSTAPKPKTMGGFVADDSDTDDEPSAVKSEELLQPPATGTPNSSAQSPLSVSVVSQNGGMVDSSGPSASATNIATATVSLSNNPGDSDGYGIAPLPTAPPVTALTTGASVPKARLPHDRAGILEDRIKEDPRGDLDAWLSLIAEHRKRNKLDDARAVYERFFKVSPSAVGLSLDYDHADLLTCHLG